MSTNYKRGDNALRDKINAKNDSSYNTRFLKKSDLKDQVNAKFFANKPFTDFGDLIQQTKTNEDNVLIKINSKLSVNDTIMNGIKKDYVKTDDLSTKINEMIPETSSYKSIKGFIDKNTSDITGLNEKVAKNIESIEESNKELKALMTDITGGLSGEISLKDLNDRIVKNAETIRTSAARNNREMMREVRKETGRLDAEIKSNTENISKKLDNNKNEYVRAFNEYISDDDLVNRMKGKPIEVKSIKLNEANIDKDLIVNGTKFSTVVQNLEEVVGNISKEKKVDNQD